MMNPLRPTQGIIVTNGSGTDIPPRSVVIVTGVSEVAATSTQEKKYVTTVNAWNNVRNGDVLVTGQSTIKAGGTGTAYYDQVIAVAYNPGGSAPTRGEMWGPVNNSWNLRRGGCGFYCTGIVEASATPSFAIFRRSDLWEIWCKTTAGIGAGSLSSPTAFTFNVWVPDIASGSTPKPSIVSTDSAVLGVTGYNRDSSLASSGALLRVRWDWQYGEWTPVWASC